MSHLNIVLITFPPHPPMGIKGGKGSSKEEELKFLLQSTLWKSKTFPIVLKKFKKIIF